MKKFTILIGIALISNLILGQNTFEKTYDINLPLLWSDQGGRQVKQTSDGGYLLMSRIKEDMGTYANAFVKTDMYGDTILTKFIHVTSGSQFLVDFSITDDQDIIAVGCTYDSSLIVKLNSDLEVLWTQSEIDYFGMLGIESIIKTMDGNFVITGWWYEGLYMSKIDQDGDSIWAKHYSNIVPSGAIECPDSSLILFGGSEEQGIVIINTDKDGNQIWRKDLDMAIYSICSTDDGGFVASGFKYFGGGLGVIKFDSNGNELWYNTSSSACGIICRGVDEGFLIVAYPDYLIKIDDEGDLIWSQNYGDQLHDVILSNDNYIVATGIKTDKTFLVKTDQNGHANLIPNISIKNNLKLEVYPNPSSGITNIEFEFEQEEEVLLFVRDIGSKELKKIPIEDINTGFYELNCSEFSPGTYFIVLRSESGILTEKLIIE